MDIKVIKFWAPWCAPCKQYKPILDSVVAARDDIDYVEINIDEDMETASKYGVKTIPFTVIEKEGEIMETFNGAKPPKQIHKLLDGVAAA